MLKIFIGSSSSYRLLTKLRGGNVFTYLQVFACSRVGGAGKKNGPAGMHSSSGFTFIGYVNCNTGKAAPKITV